MQNNDLTIWFYSVDVHEDQESELRKLGLLDGIYVCPSGTCDPQDVLFRGFASKEEADSFSAALEGAYMCPCGPCDPQDVLFREFASKEEADSFSSFLKALFT